MSDQQVNIGRNIRAIRMQVGLTQQRLAEQCGLSKGMISKVENGVVVPALATLSKIASAMHIKLSDLIETDTQNPSVWTVNPFSNPENFIKTSMGYQIFNPAVGLSDRNLQPILVTATQNTVKPHLVSHAGEEYIFVFEGEMTFKVGDNTYLLRAGDSLFFTSLQKHGISSVNGSVHYIDILGGQHSAVEDFGSAKG